MKDTGILIVVSGFSGAGKGTLTKELVRRYPNYALSVSMTTRQPRPGEEEGKAYFFVDRATFEETIAKDGLVEYASYCDNYYGTPRAWVESRLKEGRDVILEIEIQGAMKVKERFPDALLLFVAPPSVAELKKRLIGRGTESEAVISKRLSQAAREAEGVGAYDFIIVNDDLQACVENTHAIISAAHWRPDRKQAFIDGMKEELKAF